jgi:alpha-soluble NSF attachment protein
MQFVLSILYFAQRFMGNNLLAATFFSQAGECTRKVDPSEAIKYFRKAVEYYSTDGKIIQAALCEIECAKIHEDDFAMEAAATAYQFASDYYKKAGNFTQTIVLLSKAGDVLVDSDKYV